MKTVGVLAIQGAVEKHEEMIRRLGHKAVQVLDAESLNQVDGLILPGGESTAIGKQLEWYGLMDPLRDRVASGMPIFGTCAGMILLCKNIEGSTQTRIGLLDATVRRNAYGSQIDSFECLLQVKGIPQEVPALFIRAPRIENLGPEVEILSVYEEHPVLIRQKNMLAASFHPELTDHAGIHDYFIRMI